jgi:hypothetical protein
MPDLSITVLQSYGLGTSFCEPAMTVYIAPPAAHHRFWSSREGLTRIAGEAADDIGSFNAAVCLRDSFENVTMGR